MDSFADRAGSDLLERESEVAALVDVLDAACAGTGRVALIEGPPGIGKSALLECAKQLAPGRGMRVLAARGGALERDFSFGVVRQLFEPFVTADALVARGRLFEGAAGIAAELLERSRRPARTRRAASCSRCCTACTG